MRREPNARMPGEERRIVHVSDILHTVALLEHLDVPEEAVGPNFIVTLSSCAGVSAASVRTAPSQAAGLWVKEGMVTRFSTLLSCL